MRKLLAVGILAAIPIGVGVLMVSLGGWLALRFFGGLIISICAVAAAVWAILEIFG